MDTIDVARTAEEAGGSLPGGIDIDLLIGRFWPDRGVYPDPSPKPRPAVDESSGHLVLRTSNMPTVANVAKALACRPEAAEVVRFWKETWSRNEGERYLLRARRNERDETGSPDAYAALVLRRYASTTEQSRFASASGHLADALVRTGTASRKGAGWRDWRLHVIDDAFAIGALREARPWSTTVLLNDTPFVFVGLDDVGYPILREASRLTDVVARRQSVSAALRDEYVEYWKSVAFLRSAGRTIVVRPSFVAAALTLLAMARKGIPKAFVKGMDSKSGTWTVRLHGIETVQDAAARLTGSMLPDAWPGNGVMIQEHLPFTHEQRFFVIDGRVALSVCSARHMCGLDASGRRLDPRVARLRVPENEEGAYDRGAADVVEDRSMAAAFARAARRVVAEMGKEGHRSFVLDMGLTERGVVPVETNQISMSGPYCLDRSLYVRLWRRAMDRRVARLASDLHHVVMTAPLSVVKRCGWTADDPATVGSVAARIAGLSYDQALSLSYDVVESGRLERWKRAAPEANTTASLRQPDVDIDLAIAPYARVVHVVPLNVGTKGVGSFVLATVPNEEGVHDTLVVLLLGLSFSTADGENRVARPVRIERDSFARRVPYGRSRCWTEPGWRYGGCRIDLCHETAHVGVDFERAVDGADRWNLILGSSDRSVGPRDLPSSTPRSDAVSIPLPAEVAYLALSWHLDDGDSSRVWRALSIGEHVSWMERSDAWEMPEPTHDIHDAEDMDAFRASRRGASVDGTRSGRE